jgi:transcription initiation factor TFIID subunit 9B
MQGASRADAAAASQAPEQFPSASQAKLLSFSNTVRFCFTTALSPATVKTENQIRYPDTNSSSTSNPPAMASPNANGISTPPPTTTSTSRPPQPSQLTTTTANNTQQTNATSPSTLQNTPGDAVAGASSAAGAANKTTGHPRLSTQDNGISKRPRDARLLHLWLGQLGVHAYEERVPLQLMDFAYRYTTGVLGDAIALSDSQGTGGGGGAGRGQSEGNVTLYGVKQAIASRVGYQFNPVLPKEWLKELAEERNKINLPKVEREFGLRLPPERYCLMGTGWSLKEEWESEEDFEEAETDVRMGEVEGDDKAARDVNMDDDDDDDDDQFEDAMGGEDKMET